MNEINKPYNKYSKGKIYQIYCHVTNNRYIGSTLQKLNYRLHTHKSHYKLYLQDKHHYVSVYEVLKNNKYDISLLENYPCNSKEELELREAVWVKENECVNINVPAATEEDRELNRAISNDKYIKSEKGKITREKYRKSEKGKEAEKRHKQTELYKNKMIELSKKVKCKCDSVISRGNYLRHLQSKKHLQWANKNPELGEGFEFV